MSPEGPLGYIQSSWCTAINDSALLSSLQVASQQFERQASYSKKIIQFPQ